jgi:hypothetical protein
MNGITVSSSVHKNLHYWHYRRLIARNSNMCGVFSKRLSSCRCNIGINKLVADGIFSSLPATFEFLYEFYVCISHAALFLLMEHVLLREFKCL